MADSQFNSVIFKDVTFGTVLEDIYNNSKARSNDITLMLNELRQLVTTPQQAVIIVPVIVQYLTKAIDNDNLLVKMAAIVERATVRNVISSETNSYLSTSEFQEIKQLADSYGNQLFDKQSQLANRNDKPDKDQ